MSIQTFKTNPRKIQVWIDSSCDACKASLKAIDNLEICRKDCYMHKYLTGENVGKEPFYIVLSPDYNSAGILTSYHLMVIRTKDQHEKFSEKTQLRETAPEAPEEE